MDAYLSLSGSGREVGWGWALIRGWTLLTFSAFRTGAYSRWALIRGWPLIGINTVYVISIEFLQSFLGRHFAGKPVVRLRNVGCFLRLGRSG